MPDLVKLGNTDLMVSQICIGALPMGPLQAGLDARDGGALIAHGLAAGVNFIDGAKAYGTYDHIKTGIQGHKHDLVIAQKSGSKDPVKMQDDLEQALRQIGRDYLDIYHLHAAREADPFTDYAASLELLSRMKQQGKIRAIGIATHRYQVVARAADCQEIEIIHPLINYQGMGIIDGGVDDMLAAIDRAAAAGKGIYAMKSFAGGCLLHHYQKALAFNLDNPSIHAVAIGFVRKHEIDEALFFLENGKLREPPRIREKQLVILGFCRGDGACIEHCPQSALSIIGDKAVVDKDKCILCGYCVPHCRQFCIRMA
jgi:predicted aldo/keto reductase-like oxidoreductase